MSKIKGQNFRLLEAGVAFPEASNCSITLQGNQEDVSSKDTDSMYTENDVITNSWSCQVDTYQSEATPLRAVITKFNAAAPVTIGWDQTAGALNRVAQNANFKRSGDALLNDFTMTFNDRERVQLSLQFQGTGALS